MKTQSRLIAGTLCTLMLSSWLAPQRAAAAVIYESSGGTFLVEISDFGYTAVGDLVSVIGEDLRIGSAVVPFATRTQGNTAAYTPAFLRLSLYEDGSGLPGDPIASSTVAGPSFPAGGNSASGGTPVTFLFNDVAVPDTFVFGIEHLDANLVPVDSSQGTNRFGVFLTLGDIPEVGNSAFTFLRRTGDQWATEDFEQGPAHIDIAFNTPVPEPGSVAVLLLGAFALMRRRRRRASTN